MSFCVMFKSGRIQRTADYYIDIYGFVYIYTCARVVTVWRQKTVGIERREQNPKTRLLAVHNRRISFRFSLGPYRQSQTLMRSGLRSSVGAGSGSRLAPQYSLGSSRTLPRHLDYASDTEATKVTSNTSPYYYRSGGPSQMSGIRDPNTI